MGRNYYVERLMVYWIFSMAIGIGVTRFFGLTIQNGLLIFFFGIISMILVKGLGKKKIISGLIWLALGILLLAWQQLAIDEFKSYVGTQVIIEGKVLSAPINKNTMVVELEKVNNRRVYSSGKVSVSKAYDDESAYQRGDVIQLNGEMMRPEPATNPGGFSAEDYYFSQGIYFILKAKGQCEIINSAHGIIGLANQVQQYMQDQLIQGLDEGHYATVLALLFGEKGMIDKDLYDLSQQFGVAHVFAVSGLHIGFIVAFLVGLAGLIRIDQSGIFLVGLTGILVLYCIMTNGTPSALRASIMAVLAILAVRLLRYRDIYTLMAIAAGVILVLNPGALWSIGFQLSFISTWGIIYFYPLVKRGLNYFFPSKIVGVFAVSIAAQLASAPIVAYYFYIFTPLAPVANVCIVPIIGLVVPLLLMALGVGFLFPWISTLMYSLVNWLLEIIQQILQLGEQIFSTGHVYIGQPSIVGIILYFVILIFFREGWDNLWLIRKSKKWYGGVICSLVMTVLIFSPNNMGKKEITFLDVGQGSSAVLNIGGKCIVFDGGPQENTTANFLQYSGINQIPLVVLSHPDDDHIRGLMNVLKHIKVDNLLIPAYNEPNEQLNELLRIAGEKQVNILKARNNLGLQVGQEIQVRLLSAHEASDSINNRSVITVVDVEQFRIVFPGDIDSTKMDDVAKEVHNIDVWAVPHHGSKYSYSQRSYQEIAPKVAIISSGRNNRYGHPHDTVLEGLKELEIPYWRTDQQGAITVKLGKKEIFAEEYHNMINFQKQ